MHVLILPGWQHEPKHWRYVTEALAGKVSHSVVSFPGFGDEPVQAGIDTLPDMAGWLNRYIAQYHKDEELVLIGHSFGGRVAVELASQKPAWLKALILIGSPNIYRPTMEVRLTKFLASLARPIKFFIPLAMREPLRSPDYQAAKNSALSTLYQNVIVYDQTEQLRRLTVPTCLLWGELDLQAPVSLASEIKDLIPGAELEIVNQAGHDLHLEKPDWLATKILNYVQNI